MNIWLFLLVFCINQKATSTELPNDPIVNCTVYKDNLSNAIAAFTSCAMSYAHPIKFCELCVDDYIDVLDSFKNLSLYKDDKGPCISSYVNLDRLEIIKTLYENSRDLWNRAKCYECFKIVNGRLTNNLSIETTTFINLHKNWTKCKNMNDVNATNLCRECIDDYEELTNYYISISNENEKIGVCMDIVDTMNSTRAYWSKQCCKFRHQDETIFLTSAIIALFSTALFYLSTKLCSEKKTPIILRQSRFAGSFNQVFE